jgi:hypothetical protein
MEWPKEKRTTSPERIYKILHRNLDSEEQEPHKKQEFHQTFLKVKRLLLH